jgi:hypothetical protein
LENGGAGGWHGDLRAGDEDAPARAGAPRAYGGGHVGANASLGYRAGVRFSSFVAVLFLLFASPPVRAQDPGGAPPAAEPRAAVGSPVRSGTTRGKPRKATQVERHGIRWQFAAPCTVGAFVNGDPWVIGPVQIVAITPGCVEQDGRVLHGSMIDPDPSQMLQGYDSAMFGDEKRERYDAARNVALGISAGKPLRLEPGQSLVSVQSLLGKPAKEPPNLQTAAVLTCLAKAPAPDAFRPPYVRGDKTVRHRAAGLDFAVLPRLRAPIDVPPIAEVAQGFERLWLDHFPEWPVRYSHPRDNMPDYGRDRTALVGSGALQLLLDLPSEQKRELYVRMVQIGIDLHGALRSGCRWQGIGGHGSGRKFPILLAGLALHDEQMLGIGAEFVSKRGDGGKGAWFAEDGQTFYVRATGNDVWNEGHGNYDRSHDGLPEWGFSHTDSPERDDSRWDGNDYRRCCTANGWVGQALAARVLGLQQAWNHPAFFDYVDRYMQVEHSEAWHRAWIGWHASLWDAWRKKY